MTYFRALATTCKDVAADRCNTSHAKEISRVTDLSRRPDEAVTILTTEEEKTREKLRRYRKARAGTSPLQG
jgi:hypothetical protein